MDEIKFSSQEMAEKIQAIKSGALTGGAATEVLRAASAIHEAGRKVLQALGDSLKDAANTLAYGPHLRSPQEVSGSWGRRTVTDDELAAVFSTLMGCSGKPPVPRAKLQSFSTDDKLIALTRGLDALSRIVTQRKMSVKMTNAVGDSIWVDLTPGTDGEYVRWN